MIIKLRNGAIRDSGPGQDKMLKALYGKPLGRMMLKPLLGPTVSKLAGKVLDSKLSKPLIRSFVKSNQIDLSQYEAEEYPSFNDFFSRHIKPEARPVDMDPSHLISPADSKLTVLPITQEARFTIKDTPYTVASLLQSKTLAEAFSGGQLLIFRLSVEDYHRYHYPVSGRRDPFVHIPGKLHTVNPIANDYYPIYKENTREYCTIHSQEFGDLVMMEVGALLVGKIVNHKGCRRVKRGQEKGYFQYGGSTVVVLLKQDAAVIDPDILENSRQGFETVVKYGEKIGQKPQAATE